MKGEAGLKRSGDDLERRGWRRWEAPTKSGSFLIMSAMSILRIKGTTILPAALAGACS